MARQVPGRSTPEPDLSSRRRLNGAAEAGSTPGQLVRTWYGPDRTTGQVRYGPVLAYAQPTATCEWIHEVACSDPGNGPLRCGDPRRFTARAGTGQGRGCAHPKSSGRAG